MDSRLRNSPSPPFSNGETTASSDGASVDEFLTLARFDDLVASSRTLLSRSTVKNFAFLHQQSRRKALLELSAAEAATEVALRHRIDRSLLLAAPLALQAEHLRGRLRSCIVSTETDMVGVRHHLDALETLSEALENEEQDAVDALQFLDELSTQHAVQQERAGSGAAPLFFNTRFQARLLTRRLHRVRTAQSDANTCYTRVALECHRREVALRELQKAREALYSVPREVDFSEASDEGKGSDVCDRGAHNDDPGCNQYDHAECSDCHVVAQLAYECARQGRETQVQAQESFARLQTLLKVREELYALAAELKVDL
jgi:hypothetical protein